MKKIVKNSIFLGVSLLLIITGSILERTDIKEVYLLLIYGLGFIIGVYHIFIHAIQLMIKNKSLSVDFLMIIAAIGAFYIGEYRKGSFNFNLWTGTYFRRLCNFKSEKLYKLVKDAPG